MTAERVGLILPAVMVLAAQPVYAFKLLGAKWPSPTTTMFAEFGNGTFDDAFDNAASRWVQATGFNLQVNRQFSDPCAGYSVFPDDTRNGTAFKPDACGLPWNAGDLGVTISLCSPTCGPGGTKTEADTIFNSTENWSVYSGPWQAGVSDFGRVATHELGHVIGLDTRTAFQPSCRPSFRQETISNRRFPMTSPGWLPYTVNCSRFPRSS